MGYQLKRHAKARRRPKGRSLAARLVLPFTAVAVIAAAGFAAIVHETQPEQTAAQASYRDSAASSQQRTSRSVVRSAVPASSSAHSSAHSSPQAESDAVKHQAAAAAKRAAAARKQAQATKAAAAKKKAEAAKAAEKKVEQDKVSTSGGALAGAISSAACASGSAVESGLKPDTIAVHRAVCAKFPQVGSYGGLGPREDHSTGNALDVMITGLSSQTGWAIANWLQANHARLGISYLIFSQRIWSVQRSSEGWRLMEDRGSPTANHYDHVHVTTYGYSAS